MRHKPPMSFHHVLRRVEAMMRDEGMTVVDTVSEYEASWLTGQRECEFNIVAWNEHTDEMVFARVTWCNHNTPDPVELVTNFVPTVSRMRKARREARRWWSRADVEWKGKTRFDRIDVYGSRRLVFNWQPRMKGKL